MQLKTYRLLSILLLVALLLSMAAPALAQEPTDAAAAQDVQQLSCAAFSDAEQQEFDALTAKRDASSLEGADLLRYDALAQQLNCYSAQFAAPAQPDQPKGATRETPTVTATVGTGGTYLTLKAAFDAINSGAGGLTGAIQLDVVGNTTETATAALNASGTGSASYTSVRIQPSGGAARTISGNIDDNALVMLNGADNVTIDGLNSGGNALTLSNTSTFYVGGGGDLSTLTFSADASNNTITNATILGSALSNSVSRGGTIYFGFGTTNGNDNNIISRCNIGPAGANLPNHAILAYGNTTNAATYNSGNLITGNNIYDYFAPTTSSSGIYLLTANTAWTISNNKFFQTAPRTQTFGARHAAIEVDGDSGNDGHTISGNTIGYASAAGTGTYTFVSQSSPPGDFYGIYFGYTKIGGAPSSIQGNTITAIDVSVRQFTAIYISPDAYIVFNIGNVTGNTIGSLTTPGAISFNSSSTTNSEVDGILVLSPYGVNISNNNVGGITASNSSTGAITLYGLRAWTNGGIETNRMFNNTVGSVDAPVSNTTDSSNSQTIGLNCKTGACVVANNRIRHLTTNSANAGVGPSASIIGLVVDNSSIIDTNNISYNTIHSLSNTNTTAAVGVTGLLYRGSSGGLVHANFIYNLSTPSTNAAATVNGIDLGYSSGGSFATTYDNNMVVLGNDMTANSPQINGINETVGTLGNAFYFNSVYIGGSGVAAGSANSFALHSTVTDVARDYRNNILFNARSNGGATGKHYAISAGGTAPSPAGLTSNYNVLYVTGTGGVTGLFNGLDQATLADWRTATGQDSISFVSNPQYLAPTASPPDLHINPAILTVIEGNGVAIGTVVDDFDGEPRSPLTPTDIGADAGNFIGVDLLPPGIFYAPLGNATNTSNRAFTNVTITDVSGVNTSAGTKPRVYYKRSTDGNVWNDNASGTDGWKYAEANGASSPFDFTIDYSRLNGGTGVSLGMIVQYFVVAQDLAAAPNVGINSGLFAAAPNSVALTAAAFPLGGVIRSYQLPVAFSGAYSVPGSYPSLTNPGGIFEAMNAGLLAGHVVINITADLTGETGAVALNQLTESPAGSNFTVTIKPSGAPRTITGTGTGFWLIRLNGADRVMIDGSLSGGTDRSLNISNPATAGAPAVITILSLGAGAGATNNTIKNCIISAGSGGNSSITTFGIYVGGASTSDGPDNDDLTIQNNQIRKAAIGIQAIGGTSARNDNLLVLGNTIGDSVVADSIGWVGLSVRETVNATISRNTVQNVVNPSGAASGISIAGASNSGVTLNNVTGVRYSGSAGFSGVGITIDAVTNLTLANNFVSDITGAGWVSPLANGIAGIRISGAATGINVFYNSVNLGSGSFAGSAFGFSSAALAIASTVTGLDIKNNIFATNLVNTNVAAKTYAIFSAATSNSVFTTINHNDYYVSGTQGVLGSLNGVDRTTLGAWQTASGQDVSSIAADPIFVSPTDLHINPSALRLASPVDNAGTPIAGVTVDIDGGTRDAATPDIGGDEIGVALAVTLASFSAQGGADRVTVNWETASELDNAGFNLYRATDPGGPQTLLSTIPSQGPGSAQGFVYTYEDMDVQPGQTTWYWLEDIDLGGATTLHGPVSATVQAPTAVTLIGLEAGSSTGWQPWQMAALLALLAAGWAASRRARDWRAGIHVTDGPA